MESWVIMAAPIIPHISEEIWQLMGHKNLVSEAQWPKVEKSLLVENKHTIAIQINGKKKGVIRVNLDTKEAETFFGFVDTLAPLQRKLQPIKPRRKLIAR